MHELATKPIVLLVDDEDFFRQDLAGAMRFFKYEVREACCGQDFRDKISQMLATLEVPDVLIVDNQMPDKIGEPDSQWCGFECMIDLCEKWREWDLGQRTLFLSRWGLLDLPDKHKNNPNVAQFALLQEERWLPIHTPFFILRARIQDMLKSRRT